MLSRHFLRAKALQTLYAAVTSQCSNIEEAEKLFDYNVLRLNDMGIFQLSTLPQLAFVAERILENEMQKFKPQDNQIKYLRRIAENRFIESLARGFEYRQAVNRLKVDWANQFDAFRKIINTMKTNKQFVDYLAIENPTYDDERAICLLEFKYMMNDDTLRDAIFERDLLWEDDFDQVAQYVFMLLKEVDEDKADEAMRCPQVYDKRNEDELSAFLFARKLVSDTMAHLDEVEPMIKKHLQNWDFDRVALMDILLINMAVTEFTCCPSIPERVTVDEYIELSKEFSTEKSKLFINGILDRLLIELRVQGRINKNERGMYDPEIDGDVVPEG
ncbi:MAG: transcription antitermination factor NusB [Bacteroidales bacterium]|nr:transcription antitermination factor NusB [Bacteroidales bacterium]